MLLEELVIVEVLDGDYCLCSGMKIDNGNVVCFFEVMKGDNVVMVINGEQGIVSCIDVLDSDILIVVGGKIGMLFSDFYSKVFGYCELVFSDSYISVECKVEGSQYISYVFFGEWSGLEGLMFFDDVLKNWDVCKIIWCC